MNTLEQKHKNAIGYNFWKNATTGEQLAAQACTTITIEEMKKLLEWLPMNVVFAPDDYYYLSLKNMGQISVEEIISTYINQIK